MIIADILKAKGPIALTIRPNESIYNLAQRLLEQRVGVMLVSEDGKTLLGIISERDVVRAIAMHSNTAIDLTVSSFMTRDVITCTSQENIAKVARTMTKRRIRHLPVVENNRLIGIVSIGDVLKHRINEVEFETDVLRDIAIANR